MRLNAQSMWLVGIVVLVASRSTRSDIVVAASDFLFGSGNFLSARQNDADILLDRRIRGCKRAINHPATFYSLGYVCTALLAGGFTSGHSNLYALVSMSVDIAMTLLSFFGLISGRFRDPAASFMALVVSSLFGILAAFLAGNVWGILNKLFSGSGEFALACNAHAEYRQLAARDELEDISGGCFWESLVDHFFSATSACLTFPVSILYRTRPAPHTSL